jgi:hypothetical protein
MGKMDVLLSGKIFFLELFEIVLFMFLRFMLAAEFVCWGSVN